MSDGPPTETTTTPSSLGRLSEACALAWLSALVCAFPTAIRASTGGGRFADGGLIGAAVWTSLVLPLLWLAPLAARGFRGVVSPRSVRRVAFGLVVLASLSAVLLAAFASILARATHHRGLGGVTFGLVGAGLLLAAAVVAGRAVTALEGLGERVPSWARRAPVAPLVVLAGAAIVTAPLLISGDDSSLRSSLADALLGGAVTTLAVVYGLHSALERAARVLALPLAACTIIAGYARVELAPESRAALGRAGGVPAVVLDLLERWTDADRDGSGAHFGGGDCDEGDPRRHPRADDALGDGIDADCDGRDGRARDGHILASVAAGERGNGASGDPPLLRASVTPSLAASGLHLEPSDEAPTPEPATSTPPLDVPVVPASAPATVVGAPASVPVSRPDIVLVTLDTVRADRTSIYGHQPPTTPRLEALANTGVVFEHAYAVGSDTQRALMPVVSGHPLSATPHTADEWPTIDDRVDTLAERLSRHGYQTIGVTSFTWLRADRGFGQGFGALDESPFRDGHPERTATGARAVDATIAHHAKLAADKPAFLWIHLFDAHARYLEHEGIAFGTSDPKKYLGELAYLDRELGRLIDAVASSPRAARTAWLVHGTHGEAFGEHGSDGHGTQLYDEVLRVPLFVAAPGVRPQRFGAGAVSTLDIAPTLLALAGAPSDDLPGVSLAPVLAGDSDFRRAHVVAHAYRRVALISWPLKLMTYRTSAGKERLTLFDLESDPGEQHDLAGARGDELRKLAALLPKRADHDR